MRRILVIVVLLALGGVGEVAAQQTFTEFSLQFIKVWIRDEAFGNPSGYSLNVMQGLTEHSLLKLSYSHCRGDEPRVGYIDYPLYYHDPDYPYVSEQVDQDFRVNFYQISFLRDVSTSRYRKLQAGGGICVLRASEIEHGLTTGLSDAFAYGNRIGLVLDIEIEEHPNNSGLILRLGFTHRFFFDNGDADPQVYDPYSSGSRSEGFTTTEVRIGVGYRLNWGS